ncbi:MAG TPA: endonuclease MutS2, partial [Geobacteraceae bacterium]
MTNETLQRLEFDKILQTIAGFAHGEVTAEAVLALAPLAGREEIAARFGQVEEIRRLAQLGTPLRLSPYADIGRPLALVRPEGAVLAPQELLAFIPVFRVLTAIARQFAYRTDIPLLHELAGFVTGFPDILEPLASTLNEEGEILDTASRLLAELRGRKRALTARIRKRLEEIVREKSHAIFLQDEFITQRGGRWVIPVRMDAKGMVPGVVHDVSNSGETAFMEPLEIIGLANELENLAAEEKAEQIRILRQLSAWLREDADAIEREYHALVYLDLLSAIARFADELAAEIPAIGTTPEIRLDGARHPLLLLKERAGGERVVPLDLRLGGEATVMVVTGPNTGGKTIAIKSAGLLTLMALSGIPVPAAATSVIPLVDDILVDIGDDQSIEANLSTFSAHIAKIAVILRRAGSRTLVLLDELGTGTEPGQGAAIACAVLDDLHRKGALVLATTHLTDIIGFVHKGAGMVNAAMEFDRQTLTPLYRLRSGEPGESHALEIARRYGLPDEVLAFAQGMVGRLETEFHELLGELRELRRQATEVLATAQARDCEARERERQAAERLAAARQQEREARERALLEAKELIQGARREVNAIIEEARQTKSRQAREKLAAAEAAAEARLAALRPEEGVVPEKIAVGDQVFVKTIGYDATVVAVDLKHDRLRVRAGRLELEVPLAAVAPARGKAAKAREPTRREIPTEEPTARLDLIGQRVDEALLQLEPFLNHASLAGIGEVRIVHGKGTGALRKGVREYLARHPLVA